MSTIEKAINKLSKKGADLGAVVTDVPSSEGGAEPMSGFENTKPLLQGDPFRILEEQGFRLSVVEKNQMKEEFRHIKRPLLRTAAGLGADVVDNGNVIMVASGMSGEGKTFTSVNLAFSIAMEKDKTVLLIDADVEKSALSRVFGVESEPGLADYLLGETNKLADVIFSSELDNLKILPAGQNSEHSTELYSSGNMVSLMNELSQRYSDRIIILDLPPLLLTSEAIMLAGLAGQIVMVIESHSLQADVKNAVSLFDSSQIIGLVMNKFSGESRSYYYGAPVAQE